MDVDEQEDESLLDLIVRAQRRAAKGKGRAPSTSSTGDISARSNVIRRRREDADGHQDHEVEERAVEADDALKLSAASYYVPSLPGTPQHSTFAPMYSGHLPASYSLKGGRAEAQAASVDAQLFFLLTKPKHIADRDRLVIWFNGGPGCSSMQGAMLEIGPAFVRGRGPNATLVENPGRWNEYAHVLFIDQPAGTGYSFINRGKPVSELAPAAAQLVTFMENFYTVFPEYSKMDTYLAGESYAGTTIPYLARAIRTSSTFPAPLKGLIIGNGWFSPKAQYPAYVTYGRERGLLEKSSRQTAHLDRVWKQCNSTLQTPQGDHVLVGVCEGLIDAVMQAGRETFKGTPGCIASYDVRPLQQNCGEYPQGIQEARPYLQDTRVKQAYHARAKSGKWDSCNNTISNQMWSPGSRPSVELLPDLLDSMSMLFFAGDADLMCNWIGVRDTIDDMTWRGERGFGNATEQEWYVNGTLAGTWKTARNMTWVKVFEAGHMVPIDKPYAAHDLLLRFMGVETLAAAGDASRVPSRLGKADSEAVIGKVSPNGSTLPAIISQQVEAAAAAASSAAAAVDLADTAGQPIDKERELLYGPRRTGVLVLIILSITLGLFALLRWRAEQRRRKGWVPRSSYTAAPKTGLAHSGSFRSISDLQANSGGYGGGRRISSSSAGSQPGTPSRNSLNNQYERHHQNKNGRGSHRVSGSISMSEAGMLRRIEEQEEGLYDDGEVADPNIETGGWPKHGELSNTGVDRIRSLREPDLEEAARAVFSIDDVDDEPGGPREQTNNDHSRAARLDVDVDNPWRRAS